MSLRRPFAKVCSLIFSIGLLVTSGCGGLPGFDRGESEFNNGEESQYSDDSKEPSDADSDNTNSQPTPKENLYKIQVDLDQEGKPRITLPDGMNYDISNWKHESQSLLAEVKRKDMKPVFIFHGDFAKKLKEDLKQSTEDDTNTAQQGLGPVYIGSYVITGGYQIRPVGGCVGQKAARYALRLHKNRQQLFNIKFAKYYNGRQWCYGIVETSHYYLGSGICACDKLRFNKARRYIAETAIAAGVSVGVAWWIADITGAAVILSPLPP